MSYYILKTSVCYLYHFRNYIQNGALPESHYALEVRLVKLPHSSISQAWHNNGICFLITVLDTTTMSTYDHHLCARQISF